MRGNELRTMRLQERGPLRRAAQDDLPTDVALDGEMLLAILEGGASGARHNVLTRALVWRGLRALGYAAADLALVWKTTAAEVERLSSSRLVDEHGRALDIERALNERFVETPEPGRYGSSPPGA
jgi:hypothetical protein